MEIILLGIIVTIVIINLIILLRSQSSQKNDDTQNLPSLIDNLSGGVNRVETTLRDELSRNRDESARSSKETRTELSTSFQSLGDTLAKRIGEIGGIQKEKLEDFSQNLISLNKTNDEKLTLVSTTLGDRLQSFQEKMDSTAKSNREELTSSLISFQDQFKSSVSEFNELQKEKFTALVQKQSELTQNTENKLDMIRTVVETKLKEIQSDNSEKLERMRQTVDDKLQKTLEDKLGESFRIVSDRLEQVHRGLGEMQTLANGVGDLKKVLSNVRTRGTLGEYRLEMILEQILAPEQYERNVATKHGSQQNVEFVVKLPSKDTIDEIILLPIDSKFPQDKYQSVLDAYEKADPALIDEALKELEKTIKSQAKDIRDKYINPPKTTDFAIMFLPFEGLYAEVVKRPALFEILQNEYKINVVGPSTCAAFLHSLQMGFRTLAIQRRSSEVWELLGAVKTDFGNFAKVLEGIEKNLQVASNKIQDAGRKSRTIERKLKNVQALPQADVSRILGDLIESEIADEDASDSGY